MIEVALLGSGYFDAMKREIWEDGALPPLAYIVQ
jgi:hypothetical protein